MSEVNIVIDSFGFYPVASKEPILREMELFELSLMLLGLIFGVIVILLIVISILLIYSLLQNSVQMKTRDHGIMRMLGLSKCEYITIILVQAFLFVLPSIVLAYILSFPTIWYLYKYKLKLEMSSVSVVPTVDATLRAFFVGFIIPIVSSLIPIIDALSKQLV